MKKDQIILGIDPGTQLMGYALLRITNSTPQVILIDALKLTGQKDIYARLEMIHTKVVELIKLYQPTTFAIEAPFFGKNVQSMLKLGRAQGVAIAAAMQTGLSVTEYAPKKVKQSITGNGNADKERVWKMLEQILKIEKQPAYFDATDALGVALCHYHQISGISIDVIQKNGEKSISKSKKTTTKKSSWDQFILNHPNRVKIK